MRILQVIRVITKTLSMAGLESSLVGGEAGVSQSKGTKAAQNRKECDNLFCLFCFCCFLFFKKSNFTILGDSRGRLVPEFLLSMWETGIGFWVYGGRGGAEGTMNQQIESLSHTKLPCINHPTVITLKSHLYKRPFHLRGLCTASPSLNAMML